MQLEQLQRIAAVLKISIHELAFSEPDPNESSTEELLKEIFTDDVRVPLHRIDKINDDDLSVAALEDNQMKGGGE